MCVRVEKVWSCEQTSPRKKRKKKYGVYKIPTDAINSFMDWKWLWKFVKIGQTIRELWQIQKSFSTYSWKKWISQLSENPFFCISIPVLMSHRFFSKQKTLCSTTSQAVCPFMFWHFSCEYLSNRFSIQNCGHKGIRCYHRQIWKRNTDIRFE